MRYAAITPLRLRYSVQIACAALRVSASGYYAWVKRSAAPADKTARLTAQVLAAHERTRGTYGAERLHKELVEGGCAVSLWKVKRLRRGCKELCVNGQSCYPEHRRTDNG